MRRQAAALAVDALVVRQFAADLDGRMDFTADDLVDRQDDQSIVEQQDVGGAQVARQLLVVETAALDVAQFAVFAPFRVEDEGGAVFQENLAVLKLTDANLWPVQVGHDGHFAAAQGCRFAHHAGAVDMVLRLAVGKIQAHHIDARTYHFDQDIEVSGGGADCCYDFCTTWHRSPCARAKVSKTWRLNRPAR